MRDRGRAMWGGRYRVAFAGIFGLVHGAGFATYLKSLFVEHVAGPLFGFNVGIEIGQVTVLLGAFVLLHAADRIIASVRAAGASSGTTAIAGHRRIHRHRTRRGALGTREGAVVAQRRLRLGLVALLGMLAFPVRSADAHPLHTTLAQVTVDPRSNSVVVSIRVFAGDFAAAVARSRGRSAPVDDRVSDAESFAYLSATFRVTDGAGKPVAAVWCGSRREGDVVWLCLKADGASGDLSVADQMLCELFADQVNIVQAVAGGRKASVLFTKGDGRKRLF